MWEIVERMYLQVSHRECDIQFKSESAHTLLWKTDGAWLVNEWSRGNIREW